MNEVTKRITDHLDISKNQEAGLIPQSTQGLLREIANESARPTVRPAIKALEFSEPNENGGQYCVVPLGQGFEGYYDIEQCEFDLATVAFGVVCHEFGDKVIWKGPKDQAVKAADAHNEKRILSCLEDTPADPWLPIETAPKDGTLILAVNTDLAAQNPTVIYWEVGSELFDIVPHWRTSTHEVFDNGLTHWTTLPELLHIWENCRKCSGQMKPSQALAPSLAATSSSDLIADTIHTVNSTGLTDCLKCENCGWSVTMQEDQPNGQRDE
jgi:hypothetical protein